MKCPQCDGYGKVTYIVRSGNRIISKEVGECDYCYGTGEVNDWETESTEEPLTNEEYLRGAGTDGLTAIFMQFMFDAEFKARFVNGNFITEFRKWLKEKHDG